MCPYKETVMLALHIFNAIVLSQGFLNQSRNANGLWHKMVRGTKWFVSRV